MPDTLKPDLFTFVAEVAVKRGDPLPITCNCGGVITIMPPLQEELVICAKCESRKPVRPKSWWPREASISFSASDKTRNRCPTHVRTWTMFPN